jgi:hypothetical protein
LAGCVVGEDVDEDVDRAVRFVDVGDQPREHRIIIVDQRDGVAGDRGQMTERLGQRRERRIIADGERSRIAQLRRDALEIR